MTEQKDNAESVKIQNVSQKEIAETAKLSAEAYEIGQVLVMNRIDCLVNLLSQTEINEARTTMSEIITKNLLTDRNRVIVEKKIMQLVEQL